MKKYSFFTIINALVLCGVVFFSSCGKSEEDRPVQPAKENPDDQWIFGFYYYMIGGGPYGQPSIEILINGNLEVAQNLDTLGNEECIYVPAIVPSDTITLRVTNPKQAKIFVQPKEFAPGQRNAYMAVPARTLPANSFIQTEDPYHEITFEILHIL